MDRLRRRRRAVREFPRRSCEHGLQRIVSRDAGLTAREGAERMRRVGQRVDEEPQGLGVQGRLGSSRRERAQ